MVMGKNTTGLLVWLAALLFLVLMKGWCCEGCWKQERDHLLDIKARYSIPDPQVWNLPDPFINWVDGTDCCQWERVQCNNTTRRVKNLNLDEVWVGPSESAPYLNISDFLVFEDLRTLNLSGNYIVGCVGKEGFENLALGQRFSNLEVLDLSDNLLNDTTINILSCFGGLSSLKYLSLSLNDLTVKSFHSLETETPSSNLSNLEVLDISYNDFLTNDILPYLGKLSSLKTLYLGKTGLDSELHIRGLASKLINLEVLDMTYNNFSHDDTDILSSLSGFSSLKSLILNYCELTPRSISSLSKLPSLEDLQLRGNNFNISFGTLLSSLSGLRRLKSLDLGDNNLHGSLDVTGLNSVSKLEMLDIGGNIIDNFVVHQGSKCLSSVKVLILDRMSIDISTLRKSFKVFSSIRMLNLQASEFKGRVTAGDFGDLSNLEHLQLDSSQNLLNEFFKTIGALTSLKVLSLRNCLINGTLPAADWSNLKKLEELDLSSNVFEGPLPSSFANMTSLRKLNLSSNQFSGNFAPNLASLISLEYLDFTKNQFQIPASFSLFSNHSYLKFIHGDGNKVILDSHPTFPTWVPKFQLEELSLPSTTQGSSIPFPKFLLYQNKLTLLDFTGCKFKGEFPNWLLENNTKLTELNLRDNSFTGHFKLPSQTIPNIVRIDISNNAITGQIPGNNISSIFPKLHYLDMSRNALGGSLSHEFGQMLSLVTLDVSDNNLSGRIPKNISAGSSLIRTLKLSHNRLNGPISPLLALPHLSYLVLDDNNLSGTIPSSFSNASVLSYVDLSNNHFVGKLPRLLGNSTNLVEFSASNNHLEGYIPKEYERVISLDLSGNNFSGSVPSFANCTFRRIILLGNNRLSVLPTEMFYGPLCSVDILDLSNNDITGTIEDVIANNDDFDILLLKGNQFKGEIPNRLCNQTVLTILDFSHNSLSGPIPNCLGQLPFIAHPILIDLPRLRSEVFYPPSVVQYQANFTTKTRSYKYEGTIAEYMTGMDLSHNKLDGDIPPELGKMTGIRALNLSRNYLTGRIPSTFSDLKEIESLDLSFNNLTSEIPPQLTQLTSLEVFSVAHNNLSGTTPDRKDQFITFDESSYEGNPFLCGPPLNKSCTDYIGQASPLLPNASDTAEGGFMDMDVFYISMAVSYTTVLLAIAAVLYINPYWRRVWFYFIELFITTCYYFVVDHFPKLY